MAGNQNKPLSVTKTDKRPLEVSKQNKQLSAITGVRAKKLRKLNNKKLRKRNASAQALSKKVNKVLYGLIQDQSKSRNPRDKNTKVLRSQIKSKILSQIVWATQIINSQGHESVLDHPQQESQVIYTDKFTIKTILRKNLRRYTPTGAYRARKNPTSIQFPGLRKTHIENAAPK